MPTSGSQTVSPHATTTYNFTATGPGGSVTGTGTVNVNTTVVASIAANPTDLHYRKIGDKVLVEQTSTVTWSTSNADSVTLDPNGKVDPSGSITVKGDPTDASQVPDGQPARTIDETKTFTLNATNVCGGSSTQTASIHVTGTVEPIPTVVLQSVFYPTDYPDKKNPQVGLVRSQQLALATLAGGFKKYLEYDPDAKLSVEAHADERGSKPFNQDLSERRVERIKDYLVSQGISADKVETAAYGKDQPLDKAAVSTLESTNPNPPSKAQSKAVRVGLAGVQPSRGYRASAFRQEVGAVLPAHRRRLEVDLAGAEAAAQEGTSRPVADSRLKLRAGERRLSGAFLFFTLELWR